MVSFDDWNAIDQAQAEADRIVRQRLEALSALPAPQQPFIVDPEPDAPLEPRMVSGDGFGERVYDEPRWAAGGRYVRAVNRHRPNGARITEFETLPTPEVDPDRGDYLLHKWLATMGDRGLKLLRDFRRQSDGND